MNLARYFKQFWPYDAGRRVVVAQYQRLAQDKALLADIGLRGNLWSGAPPPRDLFAAGVNEGKRLMALEIWRICKADPDDLFGHVPKAPRREA